ncbi:MAG: hypothetical protein ACREJU_15315, partial [Nitrospiraceae bacterium]
LVSLEESGGHPAQILDLLVHAEAVSAGMVRFRIGESGCGCLPHAALRLESHYRITILALDVAGHVSSDSLTGEIDLR